MSALQSLENSLNDLLVKKTPALPEGGKKALVTYLPWINLVLGVFSLLMAYWLWQWAHVASSLINYANSINAIYGGPVVTTSHLTFTVWLALAVLVVEALLFIAAFPSTRDHKKSGWDLMFYAFLANIAYAVVTIFSSYGGGHVISSLISAAIGLYLLFQIRASYVK